MATFDGSEGEAITLTEAQALTKNYRDANEEGVVKAHFFGNTIINSIQAQPGCVGVRMYYGLDDNGVQQMVLVGVDANQEDLTNGIVADKSTPCPPMCGGGNSPLQK